MIYVIYYHIEAGTKLSRFHKRCFKVHFLELKLLNEKKSHWNIFLGSNWQYGGIG